MPWERGLAKPYLESLLVFLSHFVMKYVRDLVRAASSRKVPEAARDAAGPLGSLLSDSIARRKFLISMAGLNIFYS